MTSDGARVSAIIPVYNGESYLAEAIDSVLNQTCEPKEVLVLDDGSTDGSGSIAKSYGSAVRYHLQPNRGLGAARNEAIRLSRGTFLAFLDADDVWTDDKLSLQMKAALVDPSLDIVAGHVEHFFALDLEEGLRRKIRCPTMPQPAPVVPAMLIRRSVFDRTGMFETDLRVGVDLEWYLRVQELGVRVEVLPQTVLRRRLHARNTGIVGSQHASQRLQILKAALDRRRGADDKATMSNGSPDKPDTF